MAKDKKKATAAAVDRDDDDDDEVGATEEEQENLDNATGDGDDSETEGGTSDEVSADNVGASEAAGKITRARAEATPEREAKNPDKTRPADAASEEQGTNKKVKASKKFDLVEKFLELSDYEASDVIGHSDERRTVVTSNGGKYEVSKKGTRLRKLAGPDTPAAIAAAQEEEDDD